MTLKEEFEILRGEDINVFDGDPMDIPCVEISDAEKLCKHPVVSVHMITYNHEPYIRQAIEGVVMQQTDFEFELIIGEDCSQDKTREICFEYQKKYPDKIRVLWWHENVSKVGGNIRRVTARCRGEFIAFCEGDDFWTDPLKLQKQVGIMRDNKKISLCFGRAKVLVQHTARVSDETSTGLPVGVMSGEEFSRSRLFDFVYGFNVSPIPNPSVRTLTAIIRTSVLWAMHDRFQEIFTMTLRLGDTTIWLGSSFFGDVFFMPDVVGVYRMHSGGVTRNNPGGLLRDGAIVRIFYAMKLWGLSYQSCLDVYKDILFNGWISRAEELSSCGQRNLANRMVAFSMETKTSRLRHKLYLLFLRLGILTRGTRRLCDFVFYHIGGYRHDIKEVSAKLGELLVWQGN